MHPALETSDVPKRLSVLAAAPVLEALHCPRCISEGLRASPEAEAGKPPQDYGEISGLKKFAGGKGGCLRGISRSPCGAVTPLSSSQPRRVGRELQGYRRAAPWVTGPFASHPRKWQIPEAGKKDGKPARHLTLTPPTPARRWMLLVGAKGAFPCWCGPGCRECQRRKGGLESKQRKGRKISWRGERDHKLYVFWEAQGCVCAHT